VDFYTGIIYKKLGFDPEFMTVLFTVPRCSGWLAHWIEFLGSKNQIVRPQQI